MILSASVVYTSTHLITQIFVMAGTTLAMIVLIGHVKPFKHRKKNKIEYASESCILVIMYLSFCFSDFILDAQVKF